MVSGLPKNLPPIEQNYPYSQYSKGGNIPFGGITARPYAQPVTTVDPTTGISIPTQYAHVSNENGENISVGQDGYGLRHMSQEEMAFKGISKMLIA